MNTGNGQMPACQQVSYSDTDVIPAARPCIGVANWLLGVWEYAAPFPLLFTERVEETQERQPQHHTGTQPAPYPVPSLSGKVSLQAGNNGKHAHFC